MAESVCLRRSFSNPVEIIHGIQEGDSARILGESVSFGRYGTESLSWERWSAFSRNRYLEEVEKYSKPGSVAKMKAFFESHYSRFGANKHAAVEANSDISGVEPEVQKKIENSLSPNVEEKLANCQTAICEIRAKRRSILEVTINESGEPKVENTIESSLSLNPDKPIVKDHTPICELRVEKTVDLGPQSSSNVSSRASLFPVNNLLDKEVCILESRVNGIIDGSFEIQVHEHKDVLEKRGEYHEQKVSQCMEVQEKRDIIDRTPEKKLPVKEVEKKNSKSNWKSEDSPLKQHRKTEDSPLKQNRQKTEDSPLKQRRKTEDSPLKQHRQKAEDSPLKQRRKTEDVPLKQHRQKTEDSPLNQHRRKTEDSPIKQRRNTEDLPIKQWGKTEDLSLKQHRRKTEDLPVKQRGKTDDSPLKQHRRKTEDSTLKQCRQKSEDSPLKQSLKSNVSKLSTSLARLSTPVRPKMESRDTQDGRKLGKESVDKRKSASRLANVSTNADVKKTTPMSSRKAGIGKIFTPLGKIIRDRFTSPAPSKESRNSVVRHPCVTPQSEIKRSKVALEKSFSRSKTLDQNSKSPATGNMNSSVQSSSVYPFKLRTEERAAKRREMLQKRLEKEAETLRQPAKLRPETKKSSLGVNLKASASTDIRKEVLSDDTKKIASPKTLLPNHGSKPASDQNQATFSQTSHKTITSKLGSEKSKPVSTESSSKLGSEKSQRVSTESSSKRGSENTKRGSTESSSKLRSEKSKPVSTQSSSKPSTEKSKPVSIRSSSKLGLEKSKPVSVQPSSKLDSGKSKLVSTQPSPKLRIEKSETVSTKSSTMPPVKKWQENTSPNIL